MVSLTSDWFRTFEGQGQVWGRGRGGEFNVKENWPGKCQVSIITSCFWAEDIVTDYANSCLQALCSSGEQKEKLQSGSTCPSRWADALQPHLLTASPSITPKMTMLFWPSGWEKGKAGCQRLPHTRLELQVVFEDEVWYLNSQSFRK